MEDMSTINTNASDLIILNPLDFATALGIAGAAAGLLFTQDRNQLHRPFVGFLVGATLPLSFPIIAAFTCYRAIAGTGASDDLGEIVITHNNDNLHLRVTNVQLPDGRKISVHRQG